MGLRDWLPDKRTSVVLGELVLLAIFVYELDTVAPEAELFVLGLTSFLVGLAWFNTTLLLMHGGDTNGS